MAKKASPNGRDSRQNHLPEWGQSTPALEWKRYAVDPELAPLDFEAVPNFVRGSATTNGGGHDLVDHQRQRVTSDLGLHQYLSYPIIGEKVGGLDARRMELHLEVLPFTFATRNASVSAQAK